MGKRKAALSVQLADLELRLLTGHYLGFLPTHLLESWGWSNKLRPLLKDRFSYTISFSAITNPYPDNDRVIRTFMECRQEALNAEED